MKKLYKQFNRVNFEVEDEPMDVSDLEKKRIKSKVFNQKNKKSIKLAPVAAIIFALILSLTVIGSVNPSLAAKLPLVGNIFEYINDNGKNAFHNYALFSDEIGLTDESNGIEITITDAIYDGDNLTLAYTLKSEMDLGENPQLGGFPFGQQDVGYAPSQNIVSKVDVNEYVGLYVTSLFYKNPEELVNVDWEIDYIVSEDVDNPFIKGDWSFQFSLEALESEAIIFEDIKTEHDGLSLKMNRLAKTPVSNTFTFTRTIDQNHPYFTSGEWAVFSIDFIVEDNLGNDYETIFNGTFGNSMYSVTKRFSTMKMDDDATYAIITPIVKPYKFVEGTDKDLEKAGEPFAMEPIQVPLD